MKLNKNKPKNKGKVHPSPSPSHTPSSSSEILNHLLPTTILTLISVLTLQDRQTLAYMLTHSLNCGPTSHHPHPLEGPTTTTKNKPKNKNHKTKTNHSSPCFDCCCFDCFSTFWNRWDSSPHRQLIDLAIEAFEDHLTADVEFKREKVVTADVEDGGSQVEDGGGGGDVEERGNEEVSGSGAQIEEKKLQQQQQQKQQQQQQQQKQQQQHKGLARKVLPDVIGLFNSRLWNLWGPNV